MAKTKLKWGRQRGGPVKKVPVRVTLQRRSAAGLNDQGGIMACIMGGGGRSRMTCEVAANPKTALAVAFEKLAGQLRKRPKGAFERYVPRKKRR